jgi:hypothetical protein
MHMSPEAEEIFQQVRSLREYRSRRLQCNMHYIDAAYDRKVRRIYSSAIWNRSNCTCFSSKPFCIRRFCTRRVRWIRRRLAIGG